MKVTLYEAMTLIHCHNVNSVIVAGVVAYHNVRGRHHGSVRGRAKGEGGAGRSERERGDGQYSEGHLTTKRTLNPKRALLLTDKSTFYY